MQSRMNLTNPETSSLPCSRELPEHRTQNFCWGTFCVHPHRMSCTQLVSPGRNSFVELVVSEPLVFSDHFLSSSAWCGCHFQQVCRYTDATATVLSQGAGQGRCERADVSRCAGLTDLCSREHLCIGNSVVATPSE